MPMPAGLEFNDRIAYHKPSKTYWFQCQRGGHKVRESAKTRSDIEDIRNDHDARHHRGKPAVAADRQTIGGALRRLVEYTEQLVKKGARDPHTLALIRYTGSILLRGLGADRLIASIDSDAVTHYITWRANHTRSTGKAIVDDLKLLQRLAKSAKVPLDWTVKEFVEDIAPEQNPKVPLPPGMVMDFVTALGTDCIFFDYTFTKVRTILRNREIEAIRVEDVNLGSDVALRSDGAIPPNSIRYYKRAKRKKARNWSYQPIPSDLAPVLQHRTEGKHPKAYVFTKFKKPLTQESLRWERRVAWDIAAAKWGLHPSNRGISQLRAQVTTALVKRMNVNAASKFAGHSSTAVTEQFYNLDKESFDLKLEASESAARSFRLPESVSPLVERVDP